jgi:CheY-like chemotaxis protein
VLLVEDDEALRETVESILDEAGYVVFTARDGGEALETLRKVRPALIITDLTMPGVNGWELLKELDGTPALARIPRVVVTAAANVGTVRGYTAVFVKPLRVEDLLRAVRTYATPRPVGTA